MPRIKDFKSFWLVGVIALFALLIRINFFQTVITGDTQDPYWLAKLTKGILNGEYELSATGAFYVGVQPLFPLLTSLPTRVTGDYFFSGKLIALVFGVLTVPVAYLLWKEVESKEVAILVALLVAVNHTLWEYSIRPNRYTLFVFFSTLSLFLLYKSRDNAKNLPYLAIFLGLATLSRSEGYFLMLSSVLAFLYWKRRYLSEKVEITRGQWKTVSASALIYIALTLPWHWYKTTEGGLVIPSNIALDLQKSGPIGIYWFYKVATGVGLPVFIIAVFGILLSYKRREDYLPLYLFFIIFSIPHMYFHSAATRYALPLYPLLIGWFSIGLFEIISKIQNKKRHVIIGLTLVLLLISGYTTVSENLSNANTFDVIKDAMTWFDTNAEKDASILVGDMRVYEYYTERNVFGIEWLNTYGSFNLISPLPNLLIDKEIHYYIPYDSLTPFLYEAPFHKRLSREFKIHELVFDYRKITGLETENFIVSHVGEIEEKKIVFTPLKKFENKNQTVIIYRVDWE